jgi:hypothetical protein
MGCRGVLFALTESDVARLRALEDGKARLGHLVGEIEERDFGGEWVAETDKAWDAMHRCFADGRLTSTAGQFPMNHLILGGESLCSDGDYILYLKSPDQVRDIVGAAEKVTREELFARYRGIHPDSYGWT